MLLRLPLYCRIAVGINNKKSESGTSGRAGGLICEPLKAVWPATPAAKFSQTASYFLSRRERIEVKVPNLTPHSNSLPQGERESESLWASNLPNHHFPPDNPALPQKLNFDSPPAKLGVYL
jgi:hypothetical protein